MLTRPAALTDDDLAAIAGLEQRVVRADGGRLKLSWPYLREHPSEIVDVALWHERGELVGFVGSYTFAGEPELAGMVDPSTRRRGIASALLDDALRTLRGSPYPDVLLICPRTGAGGADVARARGGRADHSEHALVLRGGPRPTRERPDVTLRPAVDTDAAFVRSVLADGFSHDPGEQRTEPGSLVLERHGELIGYLRADLDGQRGDIYGFVVRADLRGQGIGSDVLARVSRDLLRRGARVVGLEVDTTNEHALRLYTAIGFERVVTEDYYRLPVPR